MVITWYGKNCFKLQSGDLVLITDPFVPLRLATPDLAKRDGVSRSEKKENKLQPFRGRADIIIRTLGSLSTHSTDSGQAHPKSSGEAFEINYAGEYEIKNVIVKGWPTQNLRSVYLVEMDGFKIVLLGHLAKESEIENFQEHLEEADILFIPASGKPFLDVSSAAKLIRQLKPALVVPALFDDFKQLKPFLKELGKNEVVPQEKLTVSKKDLSQEKLLIGCLKT